MTIQRELWNIGRRKVGVIDHVYVEVNGNTIDALFQAGKRLCGCLPPSPSDLVYGVLHKGVAGQDMTFRLIQLGRVVPEQYNLIWSE
jgi:hypothetical protein